MVKIRLQRFGRKNRPFYRIVAADARSAAQGKFLVVLGHYDPIKKMCVIDNESIDAWTKTGAQMTAAVSNLIQKGGVLEERTEKKPNRKSVKRVEQEKKEKEAEEKARKEAEAAAKAAAEEEKKQAAEAAEAAKNQPEAEVVEGETEAPAEAA